VFNVKHLALFDNRFDPDFTAASRGLLATAATALAFAEVFDN